MRTFFAMGREGRDEIGSLNEVRRIYFASQAGGAKQQDPATKLAAEKQPIFELSLLTSYFYFRRWSVERIRARFPNIRVRIFADSGGFSASTLGEHVRLKDYIGWIRKNQAGLDVYANLDAIGDGEKTRRNQLVMEAEGLSPIPVYHVGSEWKYLDEILERGYPYIALGGMVPYMRGGGKKKLAVWLRGVFNRIGERGTKVHGFGIGTTWSIAKEFPWHSIDSSSWASVFQFRQCAVFDDERGRFVDLNLGSKSKEILHYGDLIRRYGFRLSDFYPSSRYDTIKAGALSVMSVLRAEAWLRRHHAQSA